MDVIYFCDIHCIQKETEFYMVRLSTAQPRSSPVQGPFQPNLVEWSQLHDKTKQTNKQTWETMSLRRYIPSSPRLAEVHYSPQCIIPSLHEPWEAKGKPRQWLSRKTVVGWERLGGKSMQSRAEFRNVSPQNMRFQNIKKKCENKNPCPTNIRTQSACSKKKKKKAWCHILINPVREVETGGSQGFSGQAALPNWWAPSQWETPQKQGGYHLRNNWGWPLTITHKSTQTHISTQRGMKTYVQSRSTIARSWGIC